MAKIDFLKDRAEDFLSNAKDLIKKGIYPLAAFNLEQALQQTHFLGELLRGIGKAYKKEKEIEKIIEKNANIIADLEHAYITSRYLPAEFFKSQVENMLNFVEKVINFLKKLKI